MILLKRIRKARNDDIFQAAIVGLQFATLVWLVYYLQYQFGKNHLPYIGALGISLLLLLIFLVIPFLEEESSLKKHIAILKYFNSDRFSLVNKWECKEFTSDRLIVEGFHKEVYFRFHYKVSWDKSKIVYLEEIIKCYDIVGDNDAIGSSGLSIAETQKYGMLFREYNCIELNITNQVDYIEVLDWLIDLLDKESLALIKQSHVKGYDNKYKKGQIISFVEAILFEILYENEDNTLLDIKNLKKVYLFRDPLFTKPEWLNNSLIKLQKKDLIRIDDKKVKFTETGLKAYKIVKVIPFSFDPDYMYRKRMLNYILVDKDNTEIVDLMNFIESFYNSTKK